MVRRSQDEWSGYYTATYGGALRKRTWGVVYWYGGMTTTHYHAYLTRATIFNKQGSKEKHLISYMLPVLGFRNTPNRQPNFLDMVS